MDAFKSCLLLSLCLGPSLTAPTGDLVNMLPGYQGSKLSWKQYSGYLSATGDKKLHYWFLESQSDPANDPLVLWMNGGPGCSSDLGLLSEHGPFRISKDGQTVNNSNQYSWNKIANMVYLEAPAGVGFSYSPDKNYTTNDDIVSLDNYHAIKDFFTKFPEYQKNEFFITGESYGGIYVPTLSARVVDDAAINFKGFAVGNGLSDANMNTDSLVYFSYYHGVIGDDLWSNLLTTCCPQKETRCPFSENSVRPACRQALEQVITLVYSSGLNEYNLYGPCEGQKDMAYNSQTKKLTYTHLNWQFSRDPHVIKHIQWLQTFADQSNNVRLTPPCLDYENVVTYMNRKDVRAALHIPDGVQDWDICSSEINLHYKTLYTNMKSQYLKVLAKQKRVLVYNGDVDMACNFLGDEWFVDSLGQKTVNSRKLWHFKDNESQTQVGGAVKELEGISLVTIRGAGHMVPTDKPSSALIMFTNFIKNQPYN